MENFEAKMNDLVAKLNMIEKRKHERNGYPFLADIVHWNPRGKKFVKIDIGGSGAWMVEKATGEIYNIKAYGVPDYNKKQKADIGNLDNVDPENMHNRRWNYLR